MPEGLPQVKPHLAFKKPTCSKQNIFLCLLWILEKKLYPLQY